MLPPPTVVPNSVAMVSCHVLLGLITAGFNVIYDALAAEDTTALKMIPLVAARPSRAPPPSMECPNADALLL
jgi:hypothetical protein